MELNQTYHVSRKTVLSNALTTHHRRLCIILLSAEICLLLHTCEAQKPDLLLATTCEQASLCMYGQLCISWSWLCCDFGVIGDTSARGCMFCVWQEAFFKDVFNSCVFFHSSGLNDFIHSRLCTSKMQFVFVDSLGHTSRSTSIVRSQRSLLTQFTSCAWLCVHAACWWIIWNRVRCERTKVLSDLS